MQRRRRLRRVGSIPPSGRLASTAADIRFSYGAESVPLSRDITAHLSALKGTVADRVDGVGHAIYLHPVSAVAYIQACRV